MELPNISEQRRWCFDQTVSTIRGEVEGKMLKSPPKSENESLTQELIGDWLIPDHVI